MYRTLASKLDKSKNFIFPFGKGNLECRFVQRRPDYFACYLSSHSGCKMGCKYCYLTQQNQTYFDHATTAKYMEQFKLVLDYYDRAETPVEKIHINFMARGEPLANKTIINNYSELYQQFKQECIQRNLLMKVNISTIMPHIMKHHSLPKILGNWPNTRIYYSLYSTEDAFRKKWMPGAADYRIALEKLKEFENATGNEVHIHFALIEGENDDLDMIRKMAEILRKYDFNGKFNLVRYNSFESRVGRESKHIDEILSIMSSAFRKQSKIIPRVGQDVFASCGMFIKDE